MSYSLIRECWPVARKPYRCIWCGEDIPVGLKHRHEISTFDGFQDHRWHLECDKDAQAHFNSNDGPEFEAYVNERPYMNERCEAFVFDMYGRKIKGRCVNRRHIQINGKELCGRHAALEAFHLAFKAGKAKFIMRPFPAMYGEVTTTWKDGK